MLEGYRLDVVPEFLFYYRVRPDGMTRTMDHYLSQMRVERVFRSHLQRIGLIADAKVIFIICP